MKRGGLLKSGPKSNKNRSKGYVGRGGRHEQKQRVRGEGGVGKLAAIFFFPALHVGNHLSLDTIQLLQEYDQFLKKLTSANDASKVVEERKSKLKQEMLTMSSAPNAAGASDATTLPIKVVIKNCLFRSFGLYLEKLPFFSTFTPFFPNTFPGRRMRTWTLTWAWPPKGRIRCGSTESRRDTSTALFCHLHRSCPGVPGPESLWGQTHFLIFFFHTKFACLGWLPPCRRDLTTKRPWRPSLRAATSQSLLQGEQ